jgi:hypothetical protein
LAVVKTVSTTAVVTGLYILAQFYPSYKLLLAVEVNNLPSLALVLQGEKQLTPPTTIDLPQNPSGECFLGFITAVSLMLHQQFQMTDLIPSHQKPSSTTWDLNNISNVTEV